MVMIGYKKIGVYIGLSTIEAVCTLIIPDDAKKVNPIGSNKWRCNKAVVTKIESLNGDKTYRIGHSCICTEQGIRGCTYEVGRVVKPNNRYNGDDQLECAGGIHYFLTKQEAIDYMHIIYSTLYKYEVINIDSNSYKLKIIDDKEN